MEHFFFLIKGGWLKSLKILYLSVCVVYLFALAQEGKPALNNTRQMPKTYSGQALVCSSGTMTSTFSLLFKLFIIVYIEITGSVVK